jgi:hypothetical protein
MRTLGARLPRAGPATFSTHGHGSTPRPAGSLPPASNPLILPLPPPPRALPPDPPPVPNLILNRSYPPQPPSTPPSTPATHCESETGSGAGLSPPPSQPCSSPRRQCALQSGRRRRAARAGWAAGGRRDPGVGGPASWGDAPAVVAPRLAPGGPPAPGRRIREGDVLLAADGRAVGAVGAPAAAGYGPRVTARSAGGATLARPPPAAAAPADPIRGRR